MALDDERTRYESIEFLAGWLSALVPIAAVRKGMKAHAEAISVRAASLAKSSALAFRSPMTPCTEHEESTAMPTAIEAVAQSSTGSPLWGALGGVTMRDHDGSLLGAVAVAGDTGAGDEAHAKAAIEHIGFVADVEGLDVEW